MSYIAVLKLLTLLDLGPITLYPELSHNTQYYSIQGWELIVLCELRDIAAPGDRPRTVLYCLSSSSLSCMSIRGRSSR